MKTFSSAIIIVVIGAFFVLTGMFYAVPEYEQVVITQFGKPVRAVTDTGLKIKLPFIQTITRYDKRIMRWDGAPVEVPTRDKRFIWVDTTARWKIVNPMRFLQVIGTYEQAYARLDDTIDSVVKDYVSSNNLVELVRNGELNVAVIDESTDSDVVFPDQDAETKIEFGRELISRAILAEAAKAMPDFGMELVDVRFKRINYVDSVQKKVFERMISERKRIASQYRSEGEGKKSEILGQMEKDLLGISSTAFRRSEEIKGKADAEATQIYGQAYGQDPEFYTFYKTLETYRQTGFKNATVILGTDSEYYSRLMSPRK
ncbi:MAG: protease modulator HflC [Desulfomonilia bacterium]